MPTKYHTTTVILASKGSQYHTNDSNIDEYNLTQCFISCWSTA